MRFRQNLRRSVKIDVVMGLACRVGGACGVVKPYAEGYDDENRAGAGGGELTSGIYA